MIRTLRIIVRKPILAAGALALFCGFAQADELESSYRVSGVEPTGVPYSGTATISMNGGTTAEINLRVPAGDFYARCMVTETDLACYADAGDDHYMMGIYRRQATGTLEGSWTHSGFRGLGRETLRPLP